MTLIQFGILIGYMFVGALAFRGRGGVFNEIVCRVFGLPAGTNVLKTTGGRAIFGVIMSLLLVGPTVWAALYALLFFAGCSIGYFTDTDRQCDTLKGFFLMSMHGIASVAGVLGIIGLNYIPHTWLDQMAFLNILNDLPKTALIPLTVASLTQGVAYKLGHLIKINVHDLRDEELGEALFGIFLAIGCFFS